MSDSEDSDDEILPLTRVQRLITGCEEFVQKKLNSLQKQQREDHEATTKRLKVLEEKETDREDLLKPVEELKKDNETLNIRVTQLEAQIQSMPRCRCSQLFEAITKVGPMALQGDVEIHYGQANPGVSKVQVVTDQLLSATAIDTQSCQRTLDTQTAPTEMFDTNSLIEDQEANDFSTVEFQPLEKSSMSTPIHPLKRSHTATFYENFKDLPEPLKNKLGRFYSPRSINTTNDKLNDIQRAHVEFYLDKGKKRKQSPSEISTECMVNGVEDKIWPANFKPTGITTKFSKYLTQRIKNKIARDALKQAEKDQKRRFSAYENME